MAVAGALRRLLHEVIDYAGLFPPARLAMNDAVANFASYRTCSSAWMLGRFICPAARLDELSSAVAMLRSPPRTQWRVSVVLGQDAAGDLQHADAFNRRGNGVLRADTVELRVDAPEAISPAVRSARQRFDCFVEFPITDPAPFLQSIRAARVMAKVRTGGVTAEAFPLTAELARFLAACSEHGVSFKATAGLHHPLRAEYRLTYDEDPPCGTMHGFLNVLIAAALARAGAPPRELELVLEEREAVAFAIGDTIRWRRRELDDEQLRAARGFMRAFGSCSFTEPTEELAALREP